MTSGGLGVAMVDVDHFKRVNDAHGHDAGDAVLVEVARRLRQGVRASDSVVRWGGEEFLLLLRDVDPGRVGVVAARICHLVRSAPCDTGAGSVPVTCSAGYTAFPSGGGGELSWEEVVGIADRALFLAKERGRDRCVGVTRFARELPADGGGQILTDLERADRAGYLELQEHKPGPVSSDPAPDAAGPASLPGKTASG